MKFSLALRAACLVAAGWGAFQPAALAAPKDFEALLACRKMEEPEARLACYDRETLAFVESRKTQESAAVVPPEQVFGLPPLAVAEAQAARVEQPQKLDSLSARVVGLSLGENGRVIFTLDNGQVWRQLVASGDMRVQLGDTVQLSRGIVGSFFMKAPSGRTCKVNRLK